MACLQAYIISSYAKPSEKSALQVVRPLLLIIAMISPFLNHQLSNLDLAQRFDIDHKISFDPIKEPDLYSEDLQWLFFAHGGIGPMFVHLLSASTRFTNLINCMVIP